MASRTVIEEDVAKLSLYRPIKALAEKKVSDDGKVDVTAHLSMLGITFTLEEIAVLVRELPRVVERAGALAAKLKLEHYEGPKIIPIGNLNDKLAEVCATPHDVNEGDYVRVVVIVSGQDVCVVAERREKLTYVKAAALKLSGNAGRVLDAWEFRSEVGTLLLDEVLVKDLGWMPRIYLNPRAGIGGNEATLVAPVSLVQPTRKDE
jgi:hypothetical protein